MVLKICVGVRTAPVARLVTLGSVWFGLSRCTSCSMISLDSSSTLVQLSNCTVLIVVTLLLFVTSIDIDLFPLFLFRFFCCYFTYHTCFVLFTAFYSLVLVLLFTFFTFSLSLLFLPSHCLLTLVQFVYVIVRSLSLP